MLNLQIAQGQVLQPSPYPPFFPRELGSNQVHYLNRVERGPQKLVHARQGILLQIPLAFAALRLLQVPCYLSFKNLLT